MDDWFERLIRDLLWKALNDFFRGLSALAENAIRDKLRSLAAGDLLSTTPLVRVTGVDLAADTVELLVRGAFPIGGATPFLRLEVALSRSHVDLSSATAPIRITEWRQVLGDLKIEKKGAFEGELGFGYDRGAWLGQGSLKLLPARIGAAIYGGLSNRGLVLGLDGQLPPGAAIPLGPTGLGLRGIGGDFAYNFVARLEENGAPVAAPTARHYVAWARSTAVDRWQPGPIDRTAVGVGLRAVLCTLADQGAVFELNPLGFAFLVPGGALVLGGKGMLLRRKGFGVDGYFVVDIASGSLALCATVAVEIKAPPEELADFGFATLLKGSGQLDAFFSFNDPTAWFFDLGTEAKPCQLEVLTDFPVLSILFSEKAEAYLRINHHRVAFGAKVGLGGEFALGSVIRLVARLAVQLAAYIGWDPLLVRARLSVLGEIGIKVWDFSFLLKGEASPTIYFPHPTLFSFEVAFTLDLPWPIPDVSGSKKWGDDIVAPPKISSPLLAGEAVAGGFRTRQEQHILATHAVSDRQWNLDTALPWPDLVLVVPFQARVIDGVGAVVAPPVAPMSQSGYSVTHRLTALELLDLEGGTAVPGVKAVWADGPGGGTAQLHVLGTDPLSWLRSHSDLSSWAAIIPPRVVEASFGYGPRETFLAERAFGDLHVLGRGAPLALDPTFAPAVPTRVLRGDRFELRFADADGRPIEVDQLVLFLVSSREINQAEPLELSPAPAAMGAAPVGGLYGSLHLAAQFLELAAPTARLAVASAEGRDLLLYAVRYREARRSAGGATERTILVPGRYRLRLEGRSTAIHEEHAAHPDVFPSAPPIDWLAVQEFEVTFPDTTRPYCHSSTFGDPRLFARRQHPWTTWTAAAWNPTLYGVGFPLYRHHHAVVRFLVPYVAALFAAAPLRLRLRYEAGGEVAEQIAPTATPDGSSSMLPESQAWILAHGGAVPPDAELVLATLPPHPGMATLEVRFVHPVRGEVKLDEWTGCVSRFADFRSHLAWPESCLTVRHDAAGRHVDPGCATLSPWAVPWSAGVYGKAAGIDPLPEIPGKIAGAVGPLLPKPGPVAGPKPYPAELATPPVAWRLPPALARELGPLSADAAVRYARFAAATGVRFGGAADPLAGAFEPVAETALEAVVDEASRPLALWLRTPEPVDWRRVSAALTISHVVPAAGCPSGYAPRFRLDLAVGFLPSADGSAAFLTGSLGGIPTRLPRGEYLLTLRYDPAAPGLPALRPSVLAGPGPEVVKLRFLQPYGSDWPLPATHGGFRSDLIELLLRHVDFDRRLWEEAVLLDLSAEEIEARLAVEPTKGDQK